MVYEDDDEAADFNAEMADVRARRRELVGRLHDQGLSARAIADKVGVTHPTVTADLALVRPSGDDWLRAQTQRPAAGDDIDSWIRGHHRKPDRQRYEDRLAAEYNPKETK